jgi:UDP-N-acetylmuramoylalanine--D-glutamate ligase
MTTANPTRAATIIVGLGSTGLSVLRHLAAGERRLIVMDAAAAPALLKEAQAMAPSAEFILGRLDATLLSTAAEVILSPGVPRLSPALQQAIDQGVPVIGDIELFARECLAQVIAITGSNGKSTTTTLACEILNAAGRPALAGGNLGPPALDLLKAAPAEFYVLEISSFQLESIERLPAVAATVLNISEDHLDRYPGLAEYAATKARIYRHVGRRVFNADDPMVCAMTDFGTKDRGFSVAADSVAAFRRAPGSDGKAWLWCEASPFMPVDELALVGMHNQANALAALALVWPYVQGSLAEVRAALAGFRGLPHRCRLVASRAGIDWYNDSKATNVGAAIAAVQGFGERPLILIAGGQAKGQDFRPFAAAIRGRVRLLVLLGIDAALIATACAEVTPVAHVADMDAAVAVAADAAEPGDAVLLSPACASLDMYANYMARGQHFETAVLERLAA